MNSKQFVFVLVITFVAGMVWLVSDIIFNTKASIPISEKLQSSLEPINPTFSLRVLEVINGETLSTNEITVNSPITAPTPVPETGVAIDTLVSPLPSPVSSPTTTPVPSAQAFPTANPNLTPIISLPSGTPSANPTP